VSRDYEKMSAYELIKAGLDESIAHSRGELTLRTTTLPRPPLPAGASQVIALRRKLKMSQSVFAAALNVSTKLVQAWEQGVRKPERGDLRLIDILTKQPEIMNRLILGEPSAHSMRKSGRRRGTAAA
jgi:putative transcriptional regulator